MTFMRHHGADMWQKYVDTTGLPATTHDVFLDGVRIGFEAAFLTILSLEESGGQVDASKVAPPDPLD